MGMEMGGEVGGVTKHVGVVCFDRHDAVGGADQHEGARCGSPRTSRSSRPLDRTSA